MKLESLKRVNSGFSANCATCRVETGLLHLWLAMARQKGNAAPPIPQPWPRGLIAGAGPAATGSKL